MFTIISILISVCAIVAGQLCMKKALNDLGDIDFASSFFFAYLKIFMSPFVIISISLYIIGALFWLYVLSKVDLSYAYPFMGLTFVLVAISSSIFLGEYISLRRWIGIIVICLGIFFISKS